MRRGAALLIVLLGFAVSSFRADAGDEAGPAQAPRTAEQLAALRKLVLDGLADPKPNVRVAAADAIVAAWPDSAPVLDEALASKSSEIRLEAVNLLSSEALGDQRDRIRKKFDDAHADVRRQAVRIARRLPWPEAEPSFMRLIARDPEWIVRQEALRGLESLGTTNCLHAVLEGWIAERDADRRRRYKRVLMAIVKTDCGDDEDAWRASIHKAELGARVARK